jgi:hypothetical protein
MPEERRIRADRRCKRLRVIQEHRRHDGIVQDSPTIEQQTQTLRKTVASAVHLGQPIDERLTSNQRPRIQSAVERRPNLFDRMQLNSHQDVIAAAFAEQPFEERHVCTSLPISSA